MDIGNNEKWGKKVYGNYFSKIMNDGEHLKKSNKDDNIFCFNMTNMKIFYNLTKEYVKFIQNKKIIDF